MATDVALYLNDDRTTARFVTTDLDDGSHGELVMDLSDLLTVIAILTQAAAEMVSPTKEDSDGVPDLQP